MDIDKLTSAFVIFDESDTKQVLLIRRNKNELYPLMWGLPGGRLHLRESTMAAAWREVFEETQLTKSDVLFRGYVGTYFDSGHRMAVWFGHVRSTAPILNAVWKSIGDVQRLESEGELAPNVLTAILRAAEKDAQLASFQPELLANSLEAASEGIVNCYRENESGSGWNVFLDKREVGVVASAIAVLTLERGGFRKFRPLIEKSNTWLESQQEVDGGWSTRSTKRVKAVSLTESTALVLRAVSLTAPFSAAVKEMGLRWLIQNQLDDGSWGQNQKSSTGSVFATCLALGCLSELSRFDPSRTLTWLKRIQNADGGWGIKTGSHSSPAHTAHVLLCLSSFGENCDSKEMSAALTCLRRAFVPGKGWVDTLETQSIFDEDNREVNRIEIRHYSTAWSLVALLKLGESPYSEVVQQSVQSLLSNQNPDGTWAHELAQDNKPVWATHDATLAICTLTDLIGCESFDIVKRREVLCDDVLALSGELDLVYRTQYLKNSLVPKLSFALNVFFLVAVFLSFFGGAILNFFLLPQIPWAVNLLISLIASATAPALYRVTKSRVLTPALHYFKARRVNALRSGPKHLSD